MNKSDIERWMLAPVEPTFQMSEAMGVPWEQGDGFPTRWKAALAASPKHPELKLVYQARVLGPEHLSARSNYTWEDISEEEYIRENKYGSADTRVIYLANVLPTPPIRRKTNLNKGES